MDILPFREPVSAGTHALWLVLSIPATILLLRRSGADRGRRLSFLIYGTALAACLLGSALFHGVRVPAGGLEVFDRLDHVGIFLLIAGSYTPIAWNLLRSRWRFGVLASAWGVAATGSGLILGLGVLPPLINTAIYLGMGWGAIFCYVEIARGLSHRRLLPLLLGGALYSVGALINLARWPNPWPGVFGPHEVFHLFVMAGSLSHYLFMLRVVLPGATPVAEPSTSRVVAVAAKVEPGKGRPRLQPIRVRSGS